MGANDFRPMENTSFISNLEMLFQAFFFLPLTRACICYVCMYIILLVPSLMT